jgi:Fe-S oxidoreductase
MRRTPNLHELDLCAYCPDLCLARCPVSLAGGDLTLSPWGKQSQLWRHLQGVPWGGAAGIRPLYRCLGCRACQELCRHGVDVPASLFAGRDLARREAPEIRVARSEEFDGEVAAARLRVLVPDWRWSADAEVLLLVEGIPMDPGGEAWLGEVFAALDAVGDEAVGVNPDAVLQAGWWFWERGDLGRAESAARHLHSRAGRYRRILAASPEAASFVALGWPQWDLPRPQVIPLSDYLAAAADRIAPLVDPPVSAWHDPCHLVRYLEAGDGPRGILSALLGDRLVELPRSRRETICCGAGGAMEDTAPELSEAMGRDLVALLDESGAARMITGCPRCQRALEAVAPGRAVSLYAVIAEAGR